MNITVVQRVFIGDPNACHHVHLPPVNPIPPRENTLPSGGLTHQSYIEKKEVREKERVCLTSCAASVSSVTYRDTGC